MPTVTVENYLKEIYHQQQAVDGQTLVSMGRLAEAMRVTPGTATSMIKALADSKLVEYEPRAGVRLTRTGEKLALHVLRRHRIIELFLVNMLNLDWAEVHDEAEELEHVVSDKVLDKIDALLGHPTVDPHGAPIPSARGVVREPDLSPLADCRPGQQVRVARVPDRDPRLLQFVEAEGLTPGAEITIARRDDVAATLTISRSDRGELTLGATAAERVLVEPRPSDEP